MRAIGPWLLSTFLGTTVLVQGAGLSSVQSIFVIVMENLNWSDIQGSSNAPYLNGSLLPNASYCLGYYNPPGLHPSLANYLWIEAGTNFGIFEDNDPATEHQNTTHHLVSLLHNAGISWKTYQEDIPGDAVPLTGYNLYVVRHNPFVYFDDVTGTNDPAYPYGIAHIRPFSELAADLTNNAVARYNFITPNLCHDMHDTCAPQSNPILQGDAWLAAEVPNILNSAAYTNNGALFITWDEGLSGDGPIGMLVLSPLARGGGYCNSIYYSHSSLLRTLQEIFGVGPWLGDAANAMDLSDLFVFYGFSAVTPVNGGGMSLTAIGVIPGRTNIVEASWNLSDWAGILTNTVSSNTFTFVDYSATNSSARFYRLLQQN